MNCSKCGLPALPDQKFCRACGNSLQLNTQPLADLAPSSNPESTLVAYAKTGRQGANRVTQWGFILMFIGAAIGVIGKMLLHEDIVTVVGVLLSVFGIFLTAFPYLSPSRVREPQSGRNIATLPQATPASHLPPERDPQYLPSITERTTNLLEKTAISRPAQDKDGEPSE
jgi:hypothetical protein